MAEFDYRKSIEKDTLEQFRDKPNLQALHCALAKQLQDVYGFFVQLREERNLSTAIGRQLDGIGDIAVLSRMEAGQLVGNPIPFDVIDDEMYRQFLIFKILKNTCDCTYPDIIKAFRMFWDRPLYYTEDPEQPATMIFDTGEMQGCVDTRPLFTTPLLRAAGVTLKLYARTSTPIAPAPLQIASGLGCTITETILPRLERSIGYDAEVHLGAGLGSVTEDLIPRVERNYRFSQKVKLGTGFQTVSYDHTPTVDRKISYAANVKAGSAIYSIMETPIDGMKIQ